MDAFLFEIEELQDNVFQLYDQPILIFFIE